MKRVYLEVSNTTKNMRTIIITSECNIFFYIDVRSEQKAKCYENLLLCCLKSIFEGLSFSFLKAIKFYCFECCDKFMKAKQNKKETFLGLQRTVIIDHAYVESNLVICLDLLDQNSEGYSIGHLLCKKKKTKTN